MLKWEVSRKDFPCEVSSITLLENKVKKLITLIATAVTLSGCKMGAQIYKVADVAKPEIIILNKKPHQGAIHFFGVSGVGNIDGRAEISLVLNGNTNRWEQLEGKVNFRWRGDCYTDQVEIHYIPSSVVSGRLRLRYKFNDL